MAVRLTVLGPGGGSGITASGVIAIPYPAAVGTRVSGSPFDVSAIWAGVGNEDRYVSEGPVAWVLLRNDSDSLLLLLWPSSNEPCFLHPGEVLTEPVPRDDTSFTLSVVAQNPYQVHPLQVLTVLGYNRRDIANGHLLVQSATINPSVPAAALGPGALPEGVTIGADDVTAETFGAGVLLPGAQVTGDIAANQVGPGTLDGDVTIAASQVLSSTYPVGNYTLQGILFWLLTGASAVQLTDFMAGYALYSDNVGTFAGSTSRLWLASDGSGQISEMQFGPRSGNTLNWVRYRAANFRIDGGGATTPGSFQVQGGVKTSLDAGAITTDGSGHLTAASIASLGSQATAGSFGTPIVVAQALSIAVTTTGAQTILAYAVTTTGFYRVNAYARVNNGVSGQKIVVSVSYTDPDSNSSVAVSPIANLSQVVSGADVAAFIDGAQTVQNGGLPCSPMVIHAKAGTNVNCFYTDPLNTPNDLVSFIIERLA